MSQDTSHRERLIKRLRYLWTWELFDSLFFPALVLFIAKTTHRPIGLFTFYSTCLVTWLLWQGAAYWGLKLRAVKTGSPIAAKHLRQFAALKRVNWILIGILPVLLLGKGLQVDIFNSGLDLAAGMWFYALAILEQINYYHYQLMYDHPSDRRYLIENKTLKRSSLNRALERVDI